MIQLIDFARQRFEIDHHAGSEDVGHSGMKRAGGNEMRADDLIADRDGVTGVVAAVVTRDDGGFGGESIGDVAFAFISPLRADKSGNRHVQPPD